MTLYAPIRIGAGHGGGAEGAVERRLARAAAPPLLLLLGSGVLIVDSNRRRAELCGTSVNRLGAVVVAVPTIEVAFREYPDLLPDLLVINEVDRPGRCLVRFLRSREDVVDGAGSDELEVTMEQGGLAVSRFAMRHWVSVSKHGAVYQKDLAGSDNLSFLQR